ncbi:DUF4331 domain-containing protein [Nocardioides aurantiacus]|uniref:DUF4331 domain-containing protein n=1 Tax=Nocardioides aurantiacus TaxID=86796 RepID=UPI00403F1FF7
MSSHREAPEISKDPVADSTDVYAFVSPDKPDTVTIIANYIPLQQPDGGPNFYEFGDDVSYTIHISHGGKAARDISYRFDFSTKIRNPKTFLYNTGQIKNLGDATWNRPQVYSVSRTENGRTTMLARNLPCPPVNVGKRSTPDYASLSAQAVQKVGNRTFFAGQRADAFHVDLGSVFDLGGLRPFNEAHLLPLAKMDGINSVQSYNVHTIALQVPITDLTRYHDRPTDVLAPQSVIGVWTAAARRASRVYSAKTGKYAGFGPYRQVSRLANPLFNEVLVPMAEKDMWNTRSPAQDKIYAKYVDRPELQQLLPVLYPGVFPNLAAYDKPRADLNAILLTGIPKGVVPGFQNYTGATQADMVRLNVAVPPSQEPNDLGIIGGDLAGFPNGRRINDDVVTIELRAIAGATIPLVDKSFTPDGAATAVTDGTTNTNAAVTDSFPYLGLPGGGYQTIPGTTEAS